MNTEANHEHNTELSTGERLRKAREQIGLSQQMVAERLCLKVSTVRDIEEDSISADLASTFLRGYIRSYARLVHIPEEELLPMMEKQMPLKSSKVQAVQGFALGKRRKKRDGWLMSFTWLVLFVVIGLTGAWWWQNHKVQQEEINSMADKSPAVAEGTEAQRPDTASQPVPLNTNDAGTSDTSTNVQTEAVIPDPSAVTAQPAIPDAAAPNNAVPATTQPVQTDAGVVSPNQVSTGNTAGNTVDTAGTLPVTPVTTEAADDSLALVMNFNADCWLEVTDATGKKLFSGMQRKDGTLNLNGKAPYRLKIGAPSAVQIQFQGKPVDLSRFIKSSQVARLTLNAE